MRVYPLQYSLILWGAVCLNFLVAQYVVLGLLNIYLQVLLNIFNGSANICGTSEYIRSVPSRPNALATQARPLNIFAVIARAHGGSMIFHVGFNMTSK